MKVDLYTDGGARGNPGPAAIGVVIKQEGQVVEKYGDTIGKATNNQAEYRALVSGLKKARSLFGKKKAKDLEINVFADSELLVKQLNHQYKIKDEAIQKLFIEIWNLVLDFREVKFNHVKREENKEADELLNQALDGKGGSQSLF
jgi:ribonuclease HI